MRIIEEERQRLGLVRLVKLQNVAGWVAHFKDGTSLLVDAPANYTTDQVSHLAIMEKEMKG